MYSLPSPYTSSVAKPAVAAAVFRPSAALHIRQTFSLPIRRKLVAASSSSGGSGDSSSSSSAAAPESEDGSERMQFVASSNNPASAVAPDIGKEIKKTVQKTAATFAPRASTASKNPAVPGTALYTIFEVQGYACMVLGGALSFNLIFPSTEPDIWRLMGMWSIWMFTVPSLRARDCSKDEKDALNYLFLVIPLLNVALPFFWKSFAIVWSADVITFFAMYAWKLGWLERTK